MKNSAILTSFRFLMLIAIIYSCKKEELPILSTSPVTNIAVTSASCGGIVTSDGGAGVTARGVCWSVNKDPTISDLKTNDGDSIGEFTSNLTGLTTATTYYVKAYATNSVGTAYGVQQFFTTKNDPITFNPAKTYGIVSDIEGNCYKTIQIGNHMWIAENLKTSRYNDGSKIQNVTDPDEWIDLLVRSYDPVTHEKIHNITGAFCWYNNDSAKYENDYGRLYNFGAAESGKLCPVGWHVPTLTEWNILFDPYIHIYDPTNPPYGTEGNELMETGFLHWIEPTGTNETGFSALPGGFRDYSTFSDIGKRGYFWTPNRGAVSYGANGAFYPIPVFSGFLETPLQSVQGMTTGLSVRCVKD